MPMVLASLGLIVLFGLVVIAIAFRRRPLAVYGRLSRRALRRSGLRQQFVETAVGRQSVWVGGNGPVLVLLHGAGDQAGTWAGTVPAFLKDYRIVALDLAGHGDSEPRTGPLSVGTVVAGAAAVITAIAPDAPVIVVGNSLGAWVALLLAVAPAAAAPSPMPRLARLVLVNGGALRGERTDITLTPTTRDEARLTLEALMGAKARRAPDFVVDDLIRVCRYGPIGRLAETSDEMDRYVLEGRLHEVDVPVDLLWGDQDRVFPLAYAEKMQAGLPAVRLTTLAGLGHAPHRDRPSQFNEGLRSLLARPAPEAIRAAR